MIELEDEVQQPSRSTEDCKAGIYDTTTSPTSTPSTATSPALGASSDSDACEISPCLNGGTCFKDAGGGRICSCPSDYGGVDCQTDTSGERRTGRLIDK